MDYLKGLNERQREAVLHGEGPLLILAGAGSGKTRVLTYRIAHLIEERGIFPGNILAITFTNKAANEMKERIGRLLDGDVDNLWMGTFHSVCVRILRRDIDKIGYERGFSIYDRDDQVTLIKECINEMNLDRDYYRESSVLGTISHLKDKLIAPDTYINENYSNLYARNLGKLYALYQKKLKQYNALDFDDLIIKTVELFRSAPEVIDYYQRKFQYIFVDEFQDTNKSQYELIRALTGKYKNICVVGDPDQSIYGWRGADITNILNFEKDFKDTTTILLEQNYRSTKNILNVANHIIKNNMERKDKELWTDNEEGNQVIVEKLLDDKVEAEFVANKIEELVDEGYSLNDMAILYRTNAQSRSFEDALRRRNINYKLVGGVKFYDRKEIKDIVAYLRLIQNPSDDISLKRIINVPRRGIGKSTLEKIEKMAQEKDESMYSVLMEISHIKGISTRAKNSISAFVEMMSNLMAMSEIMSIDDFINHVVHKIGYMEELEKEGTIEAQSRLENIKEFISVAVDFVVDNPEGSLEDFLSSISLLSDVDKTEDIENSVTMLTVHSAKGLEFPVVFLVGMEEGLFPIARALEKDSDLEEERRLCYVAVTRAEELLYITYTQMRTIYGRTSYSQPSRFIEEIPEELIDSSTVHRRKVDLRSPFINVVDYTRDEGLKPKDTASTKVDGGDMDVGTKVSHKKWGQGTVVQMKDKGNDKEIVIAFDTVGLKRLLLSLAPIEIIK
ncbi:MAG: DNA helicase PcrA [Tissierellia bacterium]|nr:DNA helicase PcrA [Tissierellia bacterium]